jgi:deoxyribodipyrimidine photo-lyase
MIDERRIKKITSHTYTEGVVLYWMNRDMRAQDNWALLHAQAIAHQHKIPLIVWYNLVPNFLQGSARQWQFKVSGLQKISEELEKLHIPFFLSVDETGKETVDELVSIIKKHHVGYVVTDMSPLHIQKKWVTEAGKKLTTPFDLVDAHNVIPVWVTSDKQEFAAYTIRPKIHKLISEFLVPFPKLKKQEISHDGKIPTIHWDKIMKMVPVDDAAPLIHESGSESAKKVLKQFITHRLNKYDTERNDPNADAQSGLSPYLHYGQIAPARVALEILGAISAKDPRSVMMAHKNGAKGGLGNASALLEELIVRRELADNFCYYNDDYDNPNGFPDWAKKSHEKHKNDSRQYSYTKKQFEYAQTHDPLWNAAQMEMVKTGKMHGYMRMYWAKKILQWSEDVATAMKIAIYLNDKYELDGRDPNGYAGIAWSLGGVHDRAWFERPIFGQIRYMNDKGCRSKFDVDAYVAKWLGMF